MDPIITTNTANNSDDDGSATIDSPPRPVRTSSPRQDSSASPSSSSASTAAADDYSPDGARRVLTSPTSAHHRLNATNFMKFGSIRPPISVLQSEFCATYRLWEEHDAVLRRVEQKPSHSSAGGGGTMDRLVANNGSNNRHDWRKYKPKRHHHQGGGGGDEDDHYSKNNGSSSSDDDEVDEDTEWEEAFAHLRTLYSRHHLHHYQEDLFSQGSYQNRNDFLESLFAIDDEDTREEKLEENDDDDDDVKVDTGNSQSVSETQHNVDYEINTTAEQTHFTDTVAAGQHHYHHHQQQQQQRKQRTDMENLAKLLLRPGSKLSGTMESSSSSGLKRTTATTARREYNLVIMEENKCDELGRPKGYLARQTSGNDEQCVFVHVSFVSLNDVVANLDQIDAFEDEEKRADDIDNNNTCKRNSPQSQSPLEVEDRITIQLDYVDGDKKCCGYWNPNTLSFEGTVQKLGDGNNNQGATERGGSGGGRLRNSASSNNIIMSGLISGRVGAVGIGSSSHGGDGFGTDGENADQPLDIATTAAAAEVTSATTGSSQRPQTQYTFSLSPCTHLHPRGHIQTPLWRLFTVPNFVNMMGIENISIVEEVVSFGGGGGTNSAVTTKKKSMMSEHDKVVLMDEIASDDNRKFALHRARTERLLLDTLVKLVELGTLIDFAELARKRNVAKRREKWRGRMRKITPKMPRKFRRRKNKEVAGNEEFDISTFDSVQKKKVHFYDQLAAISWDRLLEAASLQAERTCATFRRRSALLDGLTFQSDEYKYQVMSDLRANGLTLATSHSEWDQCIQMGRTVALGWSWFERGSWSCFERSAVVGKRCVYLLFQMHSRLGVSHELLEKSFRSADARISIARLESLKQVRCDDKSKDDESEEILCGVCQCDIHDAEGEEEVNEEASVVVTLPCSHSFHWNCIREWLHDHSKCPMCRVDLNE
ncbi:hypothetical protein ACHAXM_008871 [Skeletonema potamos]